MLSMCRAALAKTNIREPRIPVISNVDAQPHSDPDTIKDILARQVRSPVRHRLACMCAHLAVLFKAQLSVRLALLAALSTFTYSTPHIWFHFPGLLSIRKCIVLYMILNMLGVGVIPSELRV